MKQIKFSLPKLMLYASISILGVSCCAICPTCCAYEASINHFPQDLNPDNLQLIDISSQTFVSQSGVNQFLLDEEIPVLRESNDTTLNFVENTALLTAKKSERSTI